MKEYDLKEAKRYRTKDSTLMERHKGRDTCNILTNICLSFDAKIRTLDLGCGTGRFFQCLRNIKALTAVDLSPRF